MLGIVALEAATGIDQHAEQQCPLLKAQSCLDDQATEFDFFARVFLSRVSFFRASFVIVRAIRSSLTKPARRRASFDRRDRLTCGPAVAAISLPGRTSFASAKPPGDLLERSLQLGFLDLDLTEAGLQRDPADALGLACFCLSQLILQSGDFFPDFR